MSELKPCEWRQVPGWEGLYDVSSNGDVRSWRRGSCKGYLNSPVLKKQQVNKDGYRTVSLYRNRKCKTVSVARTVLMSFIGCPGNGYEASHINNIRYDNRLSNLVWETRKENEDRKIDHNTRPFGDNNHASKVKESEVMVIRSRRLKGESLKNISNDYGVTESAICAICKGRCHAKSI